MTYVKEGNEGGRQGTIYIYVSQCGVGAYSYDATPPVRQSHNNPTSGDGQKEHRLAVVTESERFG